MIRVTPYLDKEAKVDCQSWERGGGKAFIRVMDQPEYCRCRNCGDRGYVIITFCSKGPYKTPATSTKPSTYYPGGPRHGQGWYLIERTVQYTCANCKGDPESLPAPELPLVEPAVEDMMQELTEDMTIPARKSEGLPDYLHE